MRRNEDQFDIYKNQKQAVDMIIENPHISNQEISDAVGVSVRTVQRWKTLPEFKDALVSNARNTMLSHVPQLYSVAVEKALTGDYKMMKIVLDHLEWIETLTKETEDERKFVIEWRQIDTGSSSIG